MLIDFFHSCYNDTYSIKSRLLNTLKVPAIIRLVVLNLANFVIPFVLRFSKSTSLSSANNHADGPVVTLTSFPQRIGNIHLVIESLLRQSLLPSRIILWLSQEQFPSLADLPKNLLNLQSKGLEIYLTEGDLRSYKKYFFFLKENADCPFIIVDDDIFYPSYLLETLINSGKKHPGTVCANRCAEITKNKLYKEWPSVRGAALEPSFNLLPTGCGGVLYPAKSLHADALNKELFTDICKDADDIWLSCMAYLNKTKTVYTGKNEYLLSVNSFGNLHLHTGNVAGSNNDDRMKMVAEYYLSKLALDIFDRK